MSNGADARRVRGATWRKWDLHVHTPASIVHYYPGDDPWDRFLTDLASLPPEMSVVGINDYLFFDGYRKVLREFRSGNLPRLEAVFPVVELRIDQFVGTAGHLQKVNLHVLFSEQEDPDVLEGQFATGLNANFQLQPGMPEWSGFLSRENMETFGKAIRETVPKRKLPQYTESDLLLGFNNLVVSFDAVLERLKDTVFRNRYLIGVGKTEWASMQWNKASIAQKKDVINRANLVFVAADSASAYHEAHASLKSAGVQSSLLDCSDAHHLSDSPEKDRLGNSRTWINADPTLAGLTHALQEFDDRIFVGTEPDKLVSIRTRPSQYVDRLVVKKRASVVEDHEYFKLDLDLNPGFVAVIGKKGSGKSALLDTIGLAANSANEPDFNFLSRDRFRNRRANMAVFYEATLQWLDGEADTAGLDQEHQLEVPERVTYLPQQLIDRICEPAPGPAERFAQELGTVLFAHVPPADRLEAQDLESLIQVRRTVNRGPIDRPAG